MRTLRTLATQAISACRSGMELPPTSNSDRFEPPTLFDDDATRVSAANHEMGIDGPMRMASDLMLSRSEEGQRCLRGKR